MTNEERFHTAEERVKAVQDFRTRAHYLDTFYDDKRTTAMLRQAANDAEELEKLKARLEAVVKECEAIKSHYEKVVLSQLPVTLVIEANRILRVARGEGGAE